MAWTSPSHLTITTKTLWDYILDEFLILEEHLKLILSKTNKGIVVLGALQNFLPRPALTAV